MPIHTKIHPCPRGKTRSEGAMLQLGQGKCERKNVRKSLSCLPCLYLFKFLPSSKARLSCPLLQGKRPPLR